MPRRAFYSFFVSLFFWVWAVCEANAQSVSGVPFEKSAPAVSEPTKRYIITMRPEATTDAAEFVASHNARLQRDLAVLGAARISGRVLKAERVYKKALKGFVASLTVAQLQDLEDARKSKGQEDPILAIEPDGRAVLNPAGGFRPAEVTNQVVGTGIRRMGMDRFSLFPPPGVDRRVNVDIAFLDGGVTTNHPDLNVFRSVSFITNGTGADFVGHGTHVAGIAAALNNGIGTVGVAPGARIWSVQVISPEGGYWSDIIAGMDYVAEHADEIDVVNASIGSDGIHPAPFETITRAVQNIVNRGVVMVASAGNRARDVSGPDRLFGTSDDFYPAALREVMAVGAMEDFDGVPSRDDIRWFSSNYSFNPRTNNFVISPGMALDVAAPGVNILSTYLDGGYAYNDGTSMAAPHVAGLVALYISVNGKPRNAQEVYALRQKLVDTGQPQTEWQTEWKPDITADLDGNPEPLAVPSESWVPKARIVDRRMTGEGFEFASSTLAGWRHRYEFTQPFPSMGDGGAPLLWSPLITTNGTGQNVTVLDPGALTNQSRFYRVRSELLP